MRPLLLGLLLCCLEPAANPPAAAGNAAWPPSPREGSGQTGPPWPRGLYFEVQAGQVQSLSEARRQRSLSGAPPLAVVGPTRLELGATSRGRLVLPGAFQLSLRGPAILELDGPLAAGGPLRVVLLQAERIDLECRRQGPQLTLPAGQVLYPAVGVLALAAAGPERMRLEVRGGQPAELDLGGRYTFLLPVGFSRILPERLEPTPASYRGQRP